ncbi:MAG: glycosyltransferase family 2 protein [Flavobacteriaceae bacterium]|nr:glycosyltransferase family 2 protein [Flavobacteriaceae bacterium]
MRIVIIIPAYNEEALLSETLDSLIKQTKLAEKLLVVNDNSTDGTEQILQQYSGQHNFIEYINLTSENIHEPGSKVVRAFNEGLKHLDNQFDIICKFDADLIFPTNYLETIEQHFINDQKVGLAGGFCYIEKNGSWKIEGLTSKDHIRGALKAYRKECFEQIGGLKTAMGWDTVDELLAKYKGWKVSTDESLQVKHLKPTGSMYSSSAKLKQGEAFKKMRYGLWLTLIATAKLAIKKKSFSFFFNGIKGYLKYKGDYLVTSEEGKFIRKYRWRKIKSRLF